MPDATRDDVVYAEVHQEVRDMWLDYIPRPGHGPADALIKVAVRGICGTDVRSNAHELARPVVEVGSSSPEMSIDGRVAAWPPWWLRRDVWRPR